MTVSTERAPGAVLARPSQGRAPDFFVVGHPKCGTTALYRMLRSHPQIFMPELKETRFFAPELHPHTQYPQYPHTLDQYLALFASAARDQRTGEASPSYLRSRDAAARIAQVQPRARIVAILREPAGFLRSLHMELLRDRVETETHLAAAIAQEDVRSRERDLRPGIVYSDYVRYVEQLRRYHVVFGRERVLVLVYDDFRSDNEGTVRRVLRFLDVDDRAPIDPTEANPSVRVRSPRAEGLVRSLYLGHGPAARAANTAIKVFTPRRVRRDSLSLLQRHALYGKPDAPDEPLMLELRRRFKGEVVALSEYLDRDLVRLWGYDAID